MNYKYPIPGSTSAGSNPVPDNYFVVGNDCCGGSMTKDVDATVQVMFDYTTQLVTGVEVVSVALNVVPDDVQGLGVGSEVLTTNVLTFMISQGLLNAQYVITATARLSNNEVWIDSITVKITDCDASTTASEGLLGAPGTVDIASTLYYLAGVSQSIFNLSTPDRFGQTGILAGSNVIVYIDGKRQMPVVDYTINVSLNEVILVAACIGGDEAIFDLLIQELTIADAPAEPGVAFGRQNAAWVPVLPLTGGTMTGPITLANDPTSSFQPATKQYADTKVSRSGDTMGGSLTLAGDPSAPLQATTKQYTDTKVSRSGDTMSGPLVLYGPPATSLQAATRDYVDTKLSLAGGTMTGPITLSGDPTAAPQAATKSYVDTKLALSGGTMTGAVTLASDPTTALQATTKQYTDTKLPLAGGTMTGPITLAADPAGLLQPATKQYVDAGRSGVITDAPNDGNYYSRHNMAWVVSPGNFTDAVNDGTLYARKSAAWTHVTHADITDWTTTLAPYALTVNVPIGSNIPPVIDGTVGGSSGAAGTSPTWSRADHCHASDTSRVPISGGTMTGLLTLSGDPVTALQSVTKQYADTNLDTKLSLAGGVMTGPITLAADPISAMQPATKEYVDVGITPIGSVTMFAGASIPPNWLYCDGSSLDTTIYSKLFNVIGYQYGGSGANFNVPDIRNRFPVCVGSEYYLNYKGGEDTHALTWGETGAHYHNIADPSHNHTQSAHGHGVSDPTHVHGMNDPHHSHGASASQDAHNHTVGNTVVSGAGLSPGGGALSLGNTTTSGASQNNVYVSVAAAGTGVYNSYSGTGIGIVAADANLNAAYTGIGATDYQGGSQPHENRPPYFGIFFMIRFQ